MRLHPTVPHMPGETPPSYLSRLARINGIASMHELCADLGLSVGGIVAGRSAQLQAVADLVGMPVEPLLAGAYRATGGRHGRYMLRDQMLTAASLIWTRVRVCPACIAADRRAAAGTMPDAAAAYGRLAWKVEHLRTCPVHEMGLVDIPVRSRASALDFAEAANSPAASHASRSLAKQRAISPFEAYLHSRFTGAAAFGWLDDLPFYAAARTCEMLGAVAAFGRRVRIDNLGPDDWARAGQEGYAIASGGSEAVESLLKDLWASRRNDPSKASGPSGWWGRLYSWLEYGTKDPAYDVLRAAIVRCVAENAAFHPNERLFGNPVPYRKVHSIRTAHVESGLATKSIRAALAAAGLVGPDHEHRVDHDVTFDAEAGAEIIRALASKLTLTELASRLGLRAEMTKTLVAAGYIPAAGARFRSKAPRYAAADADTFLASLTSRAETVGQVPSGACDLPRAARRVRRPLAEAVEVLRSGRLRWVGRLAGAIGLPSVLVDLAELRGCFPRQELDGHTRREVEVILEVISPTVNALINKGHLKASVATIRTSRLEAVVVVHPPSLDAFRSRYVKLYDLAVELGTSSRALRAVLLGREIMPALSKAEFHTEFYDRNQVDGIRTAWAAHRVADRHGKAAPARGRGRRRPNQHKTPTV